MTYVQPDRDDDINGLVAGERMQKPFRGSYRRMSHRLIGLLKKKETQDEVREDRVHLGNLMRELGTQSFGWGCLLFAIVNMIPVPLGTNMILSIPLVIIAVQMMLGYETVRLPGFLSSRTIPRSGINRMIARMRPIIRRLERVAKERQTWILSASYRGLLGLWIFILAIALAAPIPTSGWGPAISIFIISFGMIERDGGIVLFGVGAGVIALIVVATMIMVILFGIKTIAGMPV